MMRTICKIVAVLFGLVAFSLIAYKTIQCGLHNRGGVEFCAFDTPLAVVEITCDILADSWLVGAPIHMLCRMKLPGRHLRMLIAIFTLNILTSFASIAHSVLLLLHREGPSFITGNAQCATSLFVCNLLVLVTFLYRRIRSNQEETTLTEPSESVTHTRAIRSPPTRQSGVLSPGRVELGVVPMSENGMDMMPARPSLWPGSLPSLPYDLSPSSTFPDLPPRRRRAETNTSNTRTGKCAASRKSESSLPPPPCPLSPTNTFPDLPPRRRPLPGSAEDMDRRRLP
ncbi:hypothetical protein AX15_007786 [Amanita polypyramis BW_CC]|nr:hypothetical protein AX15_007786 [Amanita polypyramis BW_CC]